MASADLKKVQIDQKRAQWAKDGKAMWLAIKLAGLTNKEAGARVDLEENQLSAQLAGRERPQTERFENDDVLSGPMAVAKALQRPDCFDVRWTITAKVTA